jgi:cathepsin E
VTGISFVPSNQSSAINGEITFGGTNPSKFNGPITFSPVPSVFISEGLWGLNQSAVYGTERIIFSSTSGIIDSGECHAA